MDEDESPNVKRRRRNNEREERDARQLSEVPTRQMQSLSVSGFNKKLQNNLKLGKRAQLKFFNKPSKFDGFQQVIINK